MGWCILATAVLCQAQLPQQALGMLPQALLGSIDEVTFMALPQPPSEQQQLQDSGALVSLRLLQQPPADPMDISPMVHSADRRMQKSLACSVARVLQPGGDTKQGLMRGAQGRWRIKALTSHLHWGIRPFTAAFHVDSVVRSGMSCKAYHVCAGRGWRGPRQLGAPAEAAAKCLHAGGATAAGGGGRSARAENIQQQRNHAGRRFLIFTFALTCEVLTWQQFFTNSRTPRLEIKSEPSAGQGKPF